MKCWLCDSLSVFLYQRKIRGYRVDIFGEKGKTIIVQLCDDCLTHLDLGTGRVVHAKKDD